jgi:FixJ family two-component response regulator
VRKALISIIDDDESLRLSFASLVRSLGGRARTFASAELFLSSDALANTACAISDVEMQRMSGIDMQVVLKRRGYVIPIIFVSALHSDEMRELAMAAGAVCYLEKPTNAEAIEDALAQALQDSEYHLVRVKRKRLTD